MRRLPWQTLISALVALLTTSAVAGPREPTERETAIKWAIAERPAAFDALMPPARDEAARHPICRMTSFRSPGGTDAFEFSIMLTEHCDGAVEGVLLLPKGEPLTVQLARARLSNPRLSSEEGRSAIVVERRVLATQVVRSMIRELATCRVDALASHDVRVDRRAYEMTSAAWTSVRVEFYEDGSRGTAKLMKVVRAGLKATGVAERELAFDASRIENED